nr:MAG TPA: hypothetical protein [Caudoviricetes sp.]DAH92454.1 MAG TPA: hypothetical protein [Caudoviricetes sp.]
MWTTASSFSYKLFVYLVILVFVGVCNFHSSSPKFLASRDGCFCLKENRGHCKIYAW